MESSKFKVGDRVVSLIDDGVILKGSEGTVFNINGNSIDVVWDDVVDGHDGTADNDSEDHWFVFEDEIRLYETLAGYDSVNNPSHYTSHPSGIECLDITRHMSFNLGNAVKYIWRCDLKKDAVEDLEKAVFYLNDEIEKRKSQDV